MKIKGNIQTGYTNELASYVSDTGIANEYAVLLRPSSVLVYPATATIYEKGLKVRLLAKFSNTGPSTLSVDNLTPKPIKKPSSNGFVDLEADDIVTGEIVELIYDGAIFQLRRGGMSGPSDPGLDGTSGTSGVSGDMYSDCITGASTAIPTTHPTVLTFTIQTGLSWTQGQKIVVAADSSHIIYGIVDSYNSVTGQIVISSTSNIGTGTFSDWCFNLDGAPGQSGTSGTSGSSGVNSCRRWEYGTSSQTGKWSANTTDFNTLTTISINNTDFDGINMSTWLTSFQIGGVITLTDEANQNDFGYYTITNKSIVFGVQTFTVTKTVANGTFATSDKIRICYQRPGVDGSSGTSGVDSTSGTSGITVDAGDGCYQPMFTSISNSESFNPHTSQYLQVGETVTVSGKMEFYAPTAGAKCKFAMTIPTLASFDADYRCGGTAYAILQNQSATIYAGTSTLSNKVIWEFDCPASNTTTASRSYEFHYHFTYKEEPCIDNTVPEYTMCADCSLVLTSTSNNQVGQLAAGNLSTNTCIVGNYVIDWYLDSPTGTPVFTSGNSAAADPSVTVIHPFTEPAQGGTWYPVIRWVYLDGIKYSSSYQAGVFYSPDLATCLPTVGVQNLSCSNTFNPEGTSYSHVYSYTNNVTSPTLATRSLRFDISSDTKFFPWYFYGDSVPDKIKITYVSPNNGNAETVLDYVDVGGQNIETLTASPVKLGLYFFNKLLSLQSQTYTTGDYLRIDITSNQSNAATNWVFKCKCLTVADCNIYDSNVRKITPGSLTFTWDNVNCRWILNYTRTNPSTYNTSNSLFIKYQFLSTTTSTITGAGGLGTTGPTSSSVQLYLNQRTDYGVNWNPLFTCNTVTGTKTLTKTGNQVVLSYTSSTDYNMQKQSIQDTLANANFSNYTSVDTDINHYKYWYVYFLQGTACGDGLTVRQYFTHFSNTPVYDDLNKTITITLGIVTNNYPSSSCNTIKAEIDNRHNIITNSINAANATYTSNVQYTREVFGWGYYPNTVSQTDYGAMIYERTYLNNACDLLSKGWANISTNKVGFYYLADRIKITNNADPINNWEFYRYVKVDGSNVGTPILLYQKSGGVVTLDKISDYNNGLI